MYPVTRPDNRADAIWRLGLQAFNGERQQIALAGDQLVLLYNHHISTSEYPRIRKPLNRLASLSDLADVAKDAKDAKEGD